MNLPKVAVIISHPIQHFCPLFVNYAKSTEWKIKVFFASSVGLNIYLDRDFHKEIQWPNLNLSHFDHVFLNNGETLPINSKLYAEDLERQLNNYEPNAVLIFGYIQKLQRQAYKWAKSNKKKIFYFSDSELRHHRPWYKKFVKNIILNTYYKNIDAFLTIGDANEAYYRSYGVPDYKLFRSAYPIDVQVFEEAYKNKKQLNVELRQNFSISDKDVVISVVGKFVSWKRQIDIIKAISLLDDKYDNIKLFIIGSGMKEEFLKNEAKKIKNNKIIFTDFTVPNDLSKYYAATDIYIHPAEKEPHSVAISEAIYMGCPIIISDKCGSYGPNDDVQNSYNGFVYHCGNIDELAQAIEHLSINTKLKNYFGANSRKIALNSQYLTHTIGLKKVLIFNNLL